MGFENDLPVMLWRARPDMSCEYVNRAWLEFSGYSASEALAEGWARALHPEDLARWLDTWLRAFDARSAFELEYRMRRHDGEYRWVLERGAPRYGDDGRFAGFVGVCLDIEEEKRAAEALARERRLRHAAEEASRAKDALFDALLAKLDRPLLAGVRVLVVEEDLRVRELLLKVLRFAGAETRAVDSLAEAAPALERWRADFMLSDAGRAADEGYVRIRALPAAASERHAQLAKPVEPVALLATMARLAHPAGA